MKNALLVMVAFLCVPAMAQAGAGFTKIGNVSTVTYSDTGCPNQNTCYYQVTTLDAQGFESQPAACSSSQLCVGGNTAVVSMPSSGTHSVSVSWTASTTTGVTYNVYRHIGPLPATGLGAIVN